MFSINSCNGASHLAARSRFGEGGSAGAANPVAQCGTIQCHAVASEDPRLTVQRQVIAVFVDQDMVNSASVAMPPSIGRALRRESRDHGSLPTSAATPRPADHPHLEPGRDVIQHLGTVFADHMQAATATWTGLVLDIDGPLNTGQVRSINSGWIVTNSPLSWSRPRKTSSPSWTSRQSTGPNSIQPTRSKG